uniref:Kelch-like protein 10 n=1 Tax=Salarias fasciatus TaxID=181472 RepID=A0A672JHL3_SALFA
KEVASPTQSSGFHSQHFCNMATVQEELRLAGLLCDAFLKVQDVEFQIHKIILCECSPYFEALFVKRSSPNQRDYVIDGVTPVIMELIIQFAYTGSVPVTMDNVQDLMVTANHFEIMDIVQTCSHALEEQLCPENCISIWQFTKNYCFSKLEFQVQRYILYHFEEVVSSGAGQLMQLSVHEFVHFLSRDDLIVRTERTVYEGIMKWITNDPHQRKGHLCSLISKMRLCMMSSTDIMNVLLSNDLVKKDSQCRAMVTRVSRILRYLNNHHAGDIFSNPFARPRQPNAILVAIGGLNEANVLNIDAYDIRVNRWFQLTAPLESPRYCHGTAFLNGYIYVIGGSDGNEQLNSVCRFNPIMKVFEEVAPMHFCRVFVSVTVLNGLIFAMGGSDGQMCHRSAEYYQPESNQWTLIAPMHERRGAASSTVLHEKIYIFGGSNGRDPLQSAECYNPQTNQWTRIFDMSIPRDGCAAVAHKNLVYVVGGFDGNEDLSSAEVYHPLTDSWGVLPSMGSRHTAPGIGVLDDHIFVVGGFDDGIHTIRAVECFDPMLNLWSDVRDLYDSCAALSCCVIHGLPNMEDYTFNRDSLPAGLRSWMAQSLKTGELPGFVENGIKI